MHSVVTGSVRSPEKEKEEIVKTSVREKQPELADNLEYVVVPDITVVRLARCSTRPIRVG